MKCGDFLARLQIVLDQHRDPLADDSLTRHAARCPECHERLEAQDRLFMALAFAVRAGGGESEPASACPLARSAPSRERRFGRLALAGLVTSAALVIAIWRGAPDKLSEQREAVAEPRAAAAVGRGSDVAVASVPGRVESRVANGDETTPAAPTTAAVSRAASWDWELGRDDLAVSLTRFNEFYETMSRVPPIPESSVPQIEHLAEEVRPLTQPFVSVFNVLRRSLPTPKGAGERPAAGGQSSFVTFGSPWA